MLTHDTLRQAGHDVALVALEKKVPHFRDLMAV